jgi:tRNA nucleotidyltransferase (CCA-adding enzyme)
MTMPEQVNWAIGMLRKNGFEAVLAGGCVRDALRGMKPRDYDIATSANPDEILRVFFGENLSTVGIKHGTTVLSRSGMQIEITAFRVDGAYRDYRHPETVSFTRSLAEDMRRRDFTINALCYGKNGLIDLTGGVADLRAGLVRCVGDPAARFNEDALRILRALRFSSELDFDIEPQTAAAAIKMRELLRKIAIERVRDELLKLLAGARAEQTLTGYRPIFEVFLPGVSSLGEAEWRKAARGVRLAEKTPETLLAALLNKRPCALEALMLPARVKRRAARLITNFSAEIRAERPAMRALVNKLGFTAAGQLINLQMIDSADPERLTRARAMLNDIKASGDCVTIARLNIDGNDIAPLAADPKFIGETLKYLLKRVIEGHILNDRGALLSEAAIFLAPGE